MQFLHFHQRSEYGPDPDSTIEFNMARYERTGLFSVPVRRCVVQKLPVIIEVVSEPVEYIHISIMNSFSCSPRSGLDKSYVFDQKAPLPAK